MMKPETALQRPTRPDGNVAQHLPFTIEAAELHRLLERGEKFAVVDVREPQDFTSGHVPGATNLPHHQWPTLEGLRRYEMNVVYCDATDSSLAAVAAAEFAGHGFLVIALAGGLQAWKDGHLPVEE